MSFERNLQRSVKSSRYEELSSLGSLEVHYKFYNRRKRGKMTFKTAFISGHFLEQHSKDIFKMLQDFAVAEIK